MAGIGKRTLLRDVNPHLICKLCRGYLIDAVTVVECLHSFCRSCILKHLSNEAHCPSCKHALNKAKPSIKADKALQDIVYKLVPGLYHKEMLRRREFCKKYPEHANSATPEQRGEDVSGRLIFNPEDVVSLSLEYLPPGADPLIILSTNDMDMNNANGANNSSKNNSNNNTVNNKRYLQCPALVTIAHLKKFIAMKYSVDITRYTIEICRQHAPLPEQWTLMDVAYIYAWKRIAPMRFFYRVAQEEQRLEAPSHQRPSTPGLGACLPPNDVQDDSNTNNNAINHPEMSESEPKQQVNQTIKIKSADNSNETISLAKDLNKITNEKHVKSLVECKQPTTTGKDETNAITTVTSTTSSISTTTTTTTMLTTVTTNVSSSSTVNVSNSLTATRFRDLNKQIKTPIKILKNPDGKYEVLRSSSSISWNGKDQIAAVTEIKTPTDPEFSVVNSNGVKITLKQCSPPQNTNPKKPKVISNVLLRCAQPEKDASSSSTLPALPSSLLPSSPSNLSLTLQSLQQQEKDKLIVTSPLSSPDKQEKQRRKVTFVDQLPTSEKVTSPTNASNVLKTALKKPADQQDKKQFLQSIQLTAIESLPDHDSKLRRSPVRDNSFPANDVKSLERNNAVPRIEEAPKKGGKEVKENSSTENASSNANTIATSTIAKRVTGMSTGNRTHAAGRIDDTNGCAPFISGTGLKSTSITSSNRAGKTDVYAFPSDPPIVPAGAVKRKCPPGVPIADVKRRKLPQTAQKEVNKKQQTVPLQNTVKLPPSASAEHVISTSRAANITVDHVGSPPRPSNISNVVSKPPSKPPSGPMLSNDTRNLLDGCGLNIPASLSITLTSPKSAPALGQQFVEPIDLNDNNRKVVLNKVNPSITLNDRSVDTRVLKALKTGQIRMPTTTTPKAKPTTAATITAATITAAKQTTIDRSETAANQQRTTPVTSKRRKEQQDSSKDVLDLSGGNKKTDIHPLRIPQPVTKINKIAAKIAARDAMQPGSISNQGQLVTLASGHRYYRAPPGSLTPAAHRVSDCPLPTSSRTPVYAPSLGSFSRSSTHFSSVFPSLQSLYALSQAPNLQQFQMDAARLRLAPRPVAETSSGTAKSGSAEKTKPSISGVPGKSHLAAQCAPVKPARSSVAPLAVPINKQSTDKLANTGINRAAVSEASKLAMFQNNESLDSTDDTSRTTVQRKYSSNVESTNNRLIARGSNDNTKSNAAATIETTKDSNAESSKTESVDTDTSLQQQQQQQQQQQHREAASPRVSSTASPSPPPGNGSVNARNEDSVNHSDNVNSNDTNASNKAASATSSPTKNNSSGSEMTCNKSPVSPDSSSITMESSGTSKSCSISTDQETASDAQTWSDIVKPSDSTANADDSVVDGSATSDDGNKLVNKSEATDAIAKQLTSEMVQKRLLAVFPSNEWAHNPIAAEHLGNFLKSLNATMKKDGHVEESDKTETSDRKIISNDGTRTSNDASVNSKKDIAERS